MAESLAVCSNRQAVGAAVVARIADHMANLRASGRCPVVRRDGLLSGLLADYRRAFQAQVAADLAFNTQALQQWAGQLGVPRQPPGATLIAALFEQLARSQAVLTEHDPWSTSQVELQCWNAFHQFYCDALALADCLHKIETGHLPPAPPPSRRHERSGASSYGRLQALFNMIEQAIPNALAARPLRGLLPVLIYQGLRTALPWPPWRVLQYLDKCHRLLRCGTLGHLAGVKGPMVRRCGVDALLNDDVFFEPGTRRTRHNIVFALSHRHSFLDLPLMAEVFRGMEYASWSNVQYFPRSAASDPLIISVKPGRGRRLAPTLDRTAELAIDQRYPLTSYVDGGTPYLLYGQQMRVKPGIRLIVDHLVHKSSGTGRRTYIVPVSFDDTVTFVRGLDPVITLSMHRPIDAQDLAPAPRRPDRSAVNRGDPLLVYLEALFLSHTGQVRHGWRTPDVEAATRTLRAGTTTVRSMRERLRKCFHATIHDLARDHAGQRCCDGGCSAADGSLVAGTQP